MNQLRYLVRGPNGFLLYAPPGQQRAEHHWKPDDGGPSTTCQLRPGAPPCQHGYSFELTGESAAQVLLAEAMRKATARLWNDEDCDA